MATGEPITIPLDLPRDEADAFAHFLKRTTYDDCGTRTGCGNIPTVVPSLMSCGRRSS
jgi:hypothetical protein